MFLRNCLNNQPIKMHQKIRIEILGFKENIIYNSKVFPPNT